MSIERIDNNNDNPKAKDQPKKKAAALNSTTFYVHNRNKWNEKREPIRWEKKNDSPAKSIAGVMWWKRIKSHARDNVIAHTKDQRKEKETALPMRQTQN